MDAGLAVVLADDVGLLGGDRRALIRPWRGLRRG
jgi:hypothetical protein